MKIYRLRAGFISVIIILLCLLFTNAHGIILVDFGATASSNSFGLAGWSTVIKSNNLNYTSLGGGGLIANSPIGEFEDYRGIRGTPRQFSVGERIVVTWYNNSNETFFFTARISFTDQNEPNEISPDGNWFTMRSFSDYRYTYTEIQPHSFAKTVFNITDSGVHKTDDIFSLVNINTTIEWFSAYQKQFLICDKIELLSDADITPPAQPTGLTAKVLSDSKIQLSWNPASDNVAVVEYLIHSGDKIEGYSRSTQYTCVFLEPKTTYTFSITALDASGNESARSATVTATTESFKGAPDLINPVGLNYLGAIVLPEDFNWGGEAIAYYCDGDNGLAGAADGFPGSLFITNLNQPDNGLVGEVNIPAPIISPQKNIAELNQAVILTQPVNIRPANVNSWDFVDIWRTGLTYLPEEKRLYSSWSIHFTVTDEKHASISCCDVTNLSRSIKYGAWYVGNANQPPIDAMMSDWLFSVPKSWADANCSGRMLVVGRCRDGGLSGLGPTLYAFSPVGSNPPSANSELPFTTLLEYGSVEGTNEYLFPNSIDGYKLSDDWRQALWLNADNQNAIAIIGNKALGHNWYGYHGERMRHDWVIADVPYPDFYETDPDGKGWRAHNRQPMIIFYNPTDLAKVAQGQIKSYEPQPYAAYRIPINIFFGKDHEIFSADYDRENRILYVIEFVRELGGRLIVHAWRIQSIPVSVDQIYHSPIEFGLSQNYPNPFNSQTNFNYSISASGAVSISIYNLQGQLIRTLVNGYRHAGNYTVSWDGSSDDGHAIGTGIYLIQMTMSNQMTSRKIIYLK